MRRTARARGLTLLEVVIALMLFALMSVMLLGGLSNAADASLRAQIERNMAELLQLRMQLVTLQPKEYEDGDEGGFPAAGASTRLIDENEVLGDRYAGYTWRVEMVETIGSGAATAVAVDGSEPRNLLFQEEGGAAGENTDEDTGEVTSEDVDQLLFIRVTVYPPDYEEVSPDEEDTAIRPHSAWTAIFVPPEEVPR